MTEYVLLLIVLAVAGLSILTAIGATIRLNRYRARVGVLRTVKATTVTENEDLNHEWVQIRSGSKYYVLRFTSKQLLAAELAAQNNVVDNPFNKKN